ncbi:hypothetical protein AUC70_10540 [Methyloceanibacter stevinii]|uniref:Uncharacterized protein n=1 Tax=Methyloceanibacter stevinii TaxID=1774970 RepID=A0A1E3VKH8_9HYPH|nr:hypothetical protein [Methyloceanibacter stevinii]ODR94012.1 hypothetical protein AUC70_10540 [Methyloceanibacter stevinii]
MRLLAGRQFGGLGGCFGNRLRERWRRHRWHLGRSRLLHRKLHFLGLGQLGNFDRFEYLYRLDNLDGRFRHIGLEEIGLENVTLGIVQRQEFLGVLDRIHELGCRIDHFDCLRKLFGLLLDKLQTAQFAGEIHDLLVFIGRCVAAGSQNTGDVVDDLVVGFALKPLVFGLGSGLIGRSLACVIVGDDPADGSKNVFHRRFRSALGAAHYLIPCRLSN